MSAGALAGLAGPLLFGVAVRSSPTATPQYRLVSDTGGALEAVCMHYRRDFHDQCFETFVDLLNALEGDTELRMAVGRREEFDFLVQELKRDGVPCDRMVPLTMHMPITPWAKDRFGTFIRDGVPVLAVPPKSYGGIGPRENDHRVPRLLATTRPGIEHATLPFMFDGGDLLADDDTAFVSANFLERNALPTAEARSALIQLISDTLDRNTVVLGRTGRDVPDHHIGMYLTPLGSNTVAVADPARGLEIWQALPPSDQVDVETDLTRYEPFRNVMRLLRRRGYRVIPIPMLLTRAPRVYVTYNNAIVETRDRTRRIYMPTYGIDVLDQLARTIFEAEGLQVLPIRVGNVYRHTGSLRCLVGIISRSQ